MLLLLWLVFSRPYLTDAQYTFARIILAFAVACGATVLTGFLTVDFAGGIQAGGALGVFALVYKLAPAALKGQSAKVKLKEMWTNVRDLPLEADKVNQDSLVQTINLLNDTATILKESPNLLESFKQDNGANYATLYDKIIAIKYPVPHEQKTADQLLTVEARNLRGKLGIPEATDLTTTVNESDPSEQSHHEQIRNNQGN